MARVELQLTPLPAHVRTARLVMVAAARRAGLADDLLDELRLAVGEAASRAVGLHRAQGSADPVVLTISDDPRVLTLTVTDRGPAAGPAPDDVTDLLLDSAEDEEGDHIDPDVALAVLTGLVDDVVVEASEAGTRVTLRWPLPPNDGPLGLPSTAAVG